MKKLILLIPILFSLIGCTPHMRKITGIGFITTGTSLVLYSTGRIIYSGIQGSVSRGQLLQLGISGGIFTIGAIIHATSDVKKKSRKKTLTEKYYYWRK